MKKKPRKPKRLFKHRERVPLPPQVEQLRDAHKVIDSNQSYRLMLPDGSIFESTGAEMIATADAYVALADAQKAGDERSIRKALERIAKI